MKTNLNLATHKFPRYRRVNLLLLLLLLSSMGAAAWLVTDFRENPPDVASLEVVERDLRVQADDLGAEVAVIEQRLGRPEAGSRMAELEYLGQVLARKRFSWTRVLQEIEDVIPRSVYLVGLIPEIDELGRVSLQMEARGRTVTDVAQFIESLETTDGFRNVKTFASENIELDDGRQEFYVVMGADYVAVTMVEAPAAGE